MLDLIKEIIHIHFPVQRQRGQRVFAFETNLVIEDLKLMLHRSGRACCFVCLDDNLQQEQDSIARHRKNSLQTVFGIATNGPELLLDEVRTTPIFISFEPAGFGFKDI